MMMKNPMCEPLTTIYRLYVFFLLLNLAQVSSYVIDVNENPENPKFNGIGGISGGGGTSRLLLSYNTTTRNEILDYLFKPQFGIASHIFKVEIGGDGQSSDATESSHMHTSDEVHYDTGYEWYLMTEAKKRNKDIKLYGLPWAFPGWINPNHTWSPWVAPDRTVEYIIKWLDGCRDVYHLNIDYIGIWNERPYNKTYIKMLRKALDDNKYMNTRIIAADGAWEPISTDILNDKELYDAVYAIGAHYPGSVASVNATKTRKPLWASEDYSTYNDFTGAECLARILNHNYVYANMTSTIVWNYLTAYYPGLMFYSQSFMTADSPWSGDFSVNAPVWAMAHTSHFTNVDMHYVRNNSGSGVLAGGGTYVTFVGGDDITIVVERMSYEHSRCIRPTLQPYTVEDETITFNFIGLDNSVTKSLHVYKTQFMYGVHANETTKFQYLGQIDIINNTITLKNTQPDSLYTLSTIQSSTAASTSAYPPKPLKKPFTVPYMDTFESYKVGSEANYFADQSGAFEIHQSISHERQFVMRQVVPERPITWSNDQAPYSIIGTLWSNVDIQVDVMIANGGVVFLGARSGVCCQPAGVYIALNSSSSTWFLTTEFLVLAGSVKGPIIKSGTLSVFKPMMWATIRLKTVDSMASAWFNNAPLFQNVSIATTMIGWPTIGTGTYDSYAEFDNFHIFSADSMCNKSPPTIGQKLVVTACGDANTPNNFVYRDYNGDHISALSSSSSSLCWQHVNNTIELATCVTNNEAQLFKYNATARSLSVGDTTQCVRLPQGYELLGEMQVVSCDETNPSAQTFTYDSERMVFRSEAGTGSFCAGFCGI